MRVIVPLLFLVACGPPTPTIPTPDCVIGFADRDGDGFGNLLLQTSDCFEPVVANSDDCDDLLFAVNPNAIEICNGIDDNCDDAIDLDDPTIDGAEQYMDADGDGYGAGDPVLQCGETDGFSLLDGDCNDAVFDVSPDAVEICDTIDNDCDGLTDDEDNDVDPASATLFYLDEDGDGFGTTASLPACVLPDGYTTNDVDCDDAEASTFPGAPERCNGLDSDCDNGVDGTTTDAVDVCADYEGFWTGAMLLDLQGVSPIECNGTVNLTVDRMSDPQVSGTMTCTASPESPDYDTTQTGVISGYVNRDGTLGGTIEPFEGVQRDILAGTMTATSATFTFQGLQTVGVDSYTLDGSVNLTP